MYCATVAAAGSLDLDWSLKKLNLENNELWE